ncbi:uncharacterized protein [Apostichopus japonicus]|uniref:uncharacterized protein isoform X1 n=1 Tax=Stichopus japonicus TaxID=307972 RepID=UPI003AB2D90B
MGTLHSLSLVLSPLELILMSLYTNRPRMAKAAMVLYFCLSTACTSDLIDEDPASWPGHLEALAIKANRLPVESLDHFPSPQAFFMNYAYSGVPVIFRGGAKSYPAFSRWSDLYLKSLPDARSTLVAVEINRKEKRSLPKLTMPFQEFLTRYRSRNEYLVTALPSFLRRDVLLPPPLLCSEITNNLVNTLLWISGGGTKSVLHNDNVNNINCVFSGRKEFLLLNYTKYKNDVLFDQVEDGAVSVDVDRVDFVKFPSLAKVDFHFANLSAGDCIFLPYKWIHQVNSYDRNIAVNVWWDHKTRIVPTKKACGYMKKGTTLNDVYFQHQGLYHGDNNREVHQVTDERDPISDLITLLEYSGNSRLTKEEFANIALEVSQWSHLNDTREVREELYKLYELIDEDGDGFLTHGDALGFKSESDSPLHDLAQKQTDVLMDLLDQQIVKEKQDQLKELKSFMEEKKAETVGQDAHSNTREKEALWHLEDTVDASHISGKDEL